MVVYYLGLGKIVLKLSQKVFLDKSDINKFSWMQEIIFYSRIIMIIW